MKEWFSSLVRIVCLIEGVGGTRFMDCLYIFRSENFSTALKKALELGYSQEQEYLNESGERVRWAFKEVISLDHLPENLDGCEVYSQPVDVPCEEHFEFSEEFDPASSKPTQTI